MITLEEITDKYNKSRGTNLKPEEFENTLFALIDTYRERGSEAIKDDSASDYQVTNITDIAFNTSISKCLQILTKALAKCEQARATGDKEKIAEANKYASRIIDASKHYTKNGN